MVLGFTISLLSLTIAVAALWTVNEITNKALRLSKELINEHAVEISRLTNTHGDEVARLKAKINMIDSELQSYRQEFRTATRTNTEEIEKLRTFCAGLENGWKKTGRSRPKPRAS